MNIEKTHVVLEKIVLNKQAIQLLGEAAAAIAYRPEGRDWLAPEILLEWLEWSPLRVHQNGSRSFECIVDARRWVLCSARLEPSAKIPVLVFPPLDPARIKGAVLVCFLAEHLHTSLLDARKIPSGKALEDLARRLPKPQRPTARQIAQLLG
ncbi:MAG: hypothetical protein ACREVM_10855, partial [Burkholderiales bacterium]